MNHWSIIRSVLGTVFVAFATSVAANADSVLWLRSDFIEKYKNRLTISCDYIVDAAHKKPNPPAKDGDMHVAGRCSEIGLPTVAEIQNAASEEAAVDRIHELEGTTQSSSVSGVWRIWPEHGGDNEFDQKETPGEKWSESPATNPPHVFEIHPITRINPLDLLASLKPIDGFDAHPASEAIPKYESSYFSLSLPSRGKIRMGMRMVGYNYIDFVMQFTKREMSVADGDFVFATIRSDDNELLARKRRVGFVAGSEPYNVERTMSEGDCVALLGIPRLDLALVSWRVANARKKPQVLSWGLPYEIIAVGVRKGPFKCPDE
jgi:hypothetical protein